ncbi:LOW QUALITY PROTEIN: allatotropin-like [Monomorium pharaonis]|uniref:LOW QUALITY PROTEIN: allatotropin-like n=1 Tax=Monomorium pharaonis TaxID=307658 RepID=UPI001746900B|nr:LOW QUALITY PROTEIN: allatotropin-like [Monomorium pharaonis]
MRTILAIALVSFVTGTFFIAAAVASKDHNYPHFFKHRMKLREIRGFKPEYISTAIGFGKRDGPAEIPVLGERERDALSVLRNLPRVVPADTLLRMIQTNPVLADKLTQLSMQSDRNDQEESMTETSLEARE